MCGGSHSFHSEVNVSPSCCACRLGTGYANSADSMLFDRRNNVRCGSDSDFHGRSRHFRLSLDNGHKADIARGPLRANTRHLRLVAAALTACSAACRCRRESASGDEIFNLFRSIMRSLTIFSYLVSRAILKREASSLGKHHVDLCNFPPKAAIRPHHDFAGKLRSRAEHGGERKCRKHHGLKPAC
jgi:hypothetical protein